MPHPQPSHARLQTVKTCDERRCYQTKSWFFFDILEDVEYEISHALFGTLVYYILKNFHAFKNSSLLMDWHHVCMVTMVRLSKTSKTFHNEFKVALHAMQRPAPNALPSRLPFSTPNDKLLTMFRRCHSCREPFKRGNSHVAISTLSGDYFDAYICFSCMQKFVYFVNDAEDIPHIEISARQGELPANDSKNIRTATDGMSLLLFQDTMRRAVSLEKGGQINDELSHFTNVFETVKPVVPTGWNIQQPFGDQVVKTVAVLSKPFVFWRGSGAVASDALRDVDLSIKCKAAFDSMRMAKEERLQLMIKSLDFHLVNHGLQPTGLYGCDNIVEAVAAAVKPFDVDSFAFRPDASYWLGTSLYRFKLSFWDVAEAFSFAQTHPDLFFLRKPDPHGPTRSWGRCRDIAKRLLNNEVRAEVTAWTSWIGKKDLHATVSPGFCKETDERVTHIVQLLVYCDIDVLHNISVSLSLDVEVAASILMVLPKRLESNWKGKTFNLSLRQLMHLLEWDIQHKIRNCESTARTKLFRAGEHGKKKLVRRCKHASPSRSWIMLSCSCGKAESPNKLPMMFCTQAASSSAPLLRPDGDERDGGVG